MSRHVIIGNGGAAISALRVIREHRPQDEIVLISKEDVPAYSPLLTPYYISGHIPYKGMFIVGQDFYARNNVVALLGHPATGVDTARNLVYVERSPPVEYDNLLIATGSSPFRPPVEGADLPGVLTLWTIADAQRLRKAISHAQSATVGGAGFIAIHVTGALVEAGKDVNILVRSRIMRRMLDQEAADLLQKELRKQGVKICLGEEIEGIQKNGKKLIVRLTSGTAIITDLVVLATGINANTEFLKNSGVTITSGIVVDRHCRTNIENIYAAGDVAESQDPVTGKFRVNATWINAQEQGRVAGLNIVGKEIS